MLQAFALLLLCQLAGEGVTRGLGLPVPGPVIGLVLMMRKRQSVATSHTSVDPVSGDRVTRQATSRTDDPPVV